MSQPTALSFEYSWPNGESVDTNQVDSWELKASRRALKNLKTLLAGQPMLDLIKDQMDQADTYFKSIIDKSNGEFTESRIDLKVKGISAAQFITWWNVWLSEMLNQPPEVKRQVFIDTMVPSHPEHYAHLIDQEGIVETIGGHLARVSLHPCPNPPECIKAFGDPSFQNLPAQGTLKDGSTFAYIYQELRDSDNGCDFRLRVLFPAAAPQLLLDEHAEHLAVEFRSFIKTAFEWNQKQSEK
ncbi:hypothetical protein MUCCIDRAFT_105696 [Mucor lusitanicus CBS 277.49]|uniref:Uncharacterized protein n=2 Tax=Mucor circinelloides f. lusitanicus TaxID=29924 RepID=A0A162ZZC4_MUCCL|nr:hypothetical protein MUCCIDRAFT_105696 [Mucor lusitanicus CBS 277.49]